MSIFEDKTDYLEYGGFWNSDNLFFYLADTYMVCSLCKNFSAVYLQFVHFLYISYSPICIYTSFNSVLKKKK